VGVVRIPGLRPGRWTLFGAETEGPGPSPALVSFDVASGAEVEVDAVNVGDCRASGRVVRGGRPLPGARASLPAVRGSCVLTDDEGRFDLRFVSTGVEIWVGLRIEPPEPGRPSASLRLADRPQLHRLRRARPADEDGPLFEWTGEIELPDRAAELRVIDEDGRAQAEAELTLMRVGDPNEGEPWVSHWRGRTDRNGRALAGGLAPGDYVVTSTLAGSRRVVRRRVVLAEDRTEVEVAYRKPASVRVRVLDADGRPVAKAGVYSLLLEAGVVGDEEEVVRHELERELRPLQTSADGEALFTDLPVGRLRVHVATPKLEGKGEVRTEAGREVSVDLVARPR
jgi:hypothetical protein